ncbi:Uncharacterised protein [Mycobacteroides abscessus subsp. abscessus]|nr:Uncharacterised protein [Mycobacteroides abscessus subsp. abscessus]
MAAAAGAVGEYHSTARMPVGMVGDSGDVRKFLGAHASSLNRADTGPWPWPRGYAALRHSVIHRLPKATASVTGSPCANAQLMDAARVSPAP